MCKFVRDCGAVFLSIFAVVSIQGQEVQLPEFYGLYAIVDGKVCGITVPTECKAPTVSVMTDAGEVQAFEYKQGLRFLVYQENPSAFVQALELAPMVFVREATRISIGEPTSRTRVNAWRFINTGPQMMPQGDVRIDRNAVSPVVFLVKPFKQSSVIAVPSRELEPGLYIVRGRDFAASGTVYIWSGDKQAAEVAKCWDIHGTFITSNYKPCAVQRTEAASPVPASSAAPTTSTDSTRKVPEKFKAEFIVIGEKFHHARNTADKVAMEKMMDERFHYGEGVTTYSVKEFLKKAKTGESISCSDYSTELFGSTPQLKATCRFNGRKKTVRMNFGYSTKVKDFVLLSYGVE